MINVYKVHTMWVLDNEITGTLGRKEMDGRFHNVTQSRIMLKIGIIFLESFSVITLEL